MSKSSRVRGKDKMTHGLAERIVRWSIFSVIIALLPLTFNYLRILVRGTTPTFAQLLSRGELLLVSAAIAAAAIGELVASGEERKIEKYVAGGSCVSVLFLTSALYAEITNAVQAGVPISSELVLNSSTLMFGFAVLSSVSCIILAELSE